MNRISKLLIVSWTAAALLTECWYVSGSWPGLFGLGFLSFAVAAVAAAFDRRVVAPIAAVAYIVPILVFEWVGRYHATYSVIWLAALTGVVLPDAVRSGWHLPRRWSVPLACWIGGICATAPIIALRAVDFHGELLFRGRLPTEALGGVPLQTLGFVLHVALLLAVGLLWFDWLAGLDEGFFLRWVAAPFALSACMLAGVALYQMFVDVNFLNYSVYAVFRRASGTVLDGNVAGALAAFWIAGWTIFALATRGWMRAAALTMVVVLWLSVWSTGSRTAFAAALIISVFSLGRFWRRIEVRHRVALAAAAVLVVVTGTVLVFRSPAGAAGPFERFRAQMPAANVASVRATARELWDRNGYGVASTRMIAAYPLFGVGVGSFYEMAGEFTPGGLTPDNAQNWYRHQLAELGLVGSVGWVAFVVSFGWWVIRRRRTVEPAVLSPARGALVGFALVSLLGMPGQDPFVAITFWTFAGWYVIVAGQPTDPAPAPRLAWVLSGVVILAFAAGTFRDATGRLRVPVRLQRLGQPYSYGFWWPEPDGEGGEYRWARKRATALVPVLTRSLELTLRSNHADLAEHPTHVVAWVDGRQVIDSELTGTADSVTVPVLLPAGERSALIETRADRAVYAPPPDGRELAVMVRWRFRPSSR